MVGLGIVSTAYDAKNKYGINFKKAYKDGYRFLDYQDFISPSSKLYKYSDESFKNYLLGLKEKMEQEGLAFSQLHACWDMEEERKGNNFERLFKFDSKAIYGAHLLECPVVVIHPISISGWWPIENINEMYNQNVIYFKKLLEVAKKYNIKIAIENLPFTYAKEISSVESIYKLIKEINSEYVGMCLDTGHLNVFKENPYDIVMLIKDKLLALHVHDNNAQSDNHSFPYQGNFNWDLFIKGLKDISFDKVLSFETSAPKGAPRKARRYMEQALASIGLEMIEELNK